MGDTGSGDETAARAAVFVTGPLVLGIFWFVCAIAGAVISFKKGGKSAVGFLLGAILGPIGLLLSFLFGSDHALAARQIGSGAKKICPRCAELVQRKASVCRYCNHAFDGDDEPSGVDPIAKSIHEADDLDTIITLSLGLVFLVGLLFYWDFIRP